MDNVRSTNQRALQASNPVTPSSCLALYPSALLFLELQQRRDQWISVRRYLLCPSETLIAGVVAGVVARTATAPLELIKTLFQLETTPIKKNARRGHQGMWHAMRSIAKEEGVAALWKGNTVGCLRLGPYSGVKFLVYDTVKARWFDNRLTTFQQLYVGSGAGIMATIFTYPLDVIKTRMSVQKNRAIYKGTWDALKKIWKVEGSRGLFKGSFATLAGVIPFEGVQFAVYETLKEYCSVNRWPSWRWADEKTESDMMDILIIGSIAGASGQTFSYPLDLVRKRIQIQANGVEGLSSYRYKGAVDCLRCIYREEGGFQAWFKGTVPNLVRVVPYGAIVFFSYEFMKSFFAWYEIDGVVVANGQRMAEAVKITWDRDGSGEQNEADYGTRQRLDLRRI